jgi:hypothetical protein
MLNPGRFSISLSLYIVGRTPRTGDQSVANPLSTHRTSAQNKRTQTTTRWVGFEPTIAAFERAKTVHALDRAATVIGACYQIRDYIKRYLPIRNDDRCRHCSSTAWYASTRQISPSLLGLSVVIMSIMRARVWGKSEKIVIDITGLVGRYFKSRRLVRKTWV